ncbi:uncharacterized protein LOC112052329 [Bicyclus anynana]|uniref:Uncharacterized protein LOC112052329 n=1 Tax=Bicyclus anynana TaxID=110368 RepID=A0ABM3LVA2_BICAN|nr:uncharacterized protein LOC112052329 [Bicyclus anynana]
MAKVKIPTLKLNNGLEFPALGYGTWLGDLKSDSFDIPAEDRAKLMDALCYALDVGYRHVDTAHVYRVEGDVGEALRRKIQEGVVTREEVFVTTKVWNHNHRPADVEASVRGSLQRLGLDYIDLVLMHWPMSISAEGEDEKIDYLEAWSGFESVLRQGLVKSIGVSNFNIAQLTRLLAHAKVVPVVNQIEINLNLGQRELVDFCKKNNIVVVAYTPFGSLMRDGPDCPATKVDDPVLTGIAKKHGRTVTQINLRYLYERGLASIPKSITKSRVLENASIFDFKLDDQDIAALETLDNNYRTVKCPFWRDFANYPFEKFEGDVPPIPPTLLKCYINHMNNNHFVQVESVAMLCLFVLSTLIFHSMCDEGDGGKAPRVTLNDGNTMPVFGLGTFLGFDEKGVKKVQEGEVELPVTWALNAGYRMLDTAAAYHNEEQVGEGVRKSGVPRENVFIVTKLGMYEQRDVLGALRRSLGRLNSSYVDLYLIHFPIATKSEQSQEYDVIDYLDTWKDMEEAKRLGLAKSIGISNFNISQIERLMDNCEIKPAVLQVEVNLNLAQNKLLEFTKAHNISVMAYSPFGTMFLKNTDAPPPRVDNPILVGLGFKYKKTVPQIALRYLVQRGVTPIPKSVTKERIEQNIDIFDFVLSDEDMDRLSEFNQNYRKVWPSFWQDHPYYPFEKKDVPSPNMFTKGLQKT